MSSQGNDQDPALRRMNDGDGQGHADAPGDLEQFHQIIDTGLMLQAPLMATLTRRQLTLQLAKDNVVPDSTIVDTLGYTYRIGDVIAPDALILPIDRKELKVARALESVRGLARLSFDLSMQSVEWDDQDPAFPNADDATSEQIGTWNLRPDQTDEFKAVYESHSAKLRSYLLRHFSNLFRGTIEVDDVAQESWAKAMRYWNRFTPDTNRNAWLTRLASNVAINVWRKQQRNKVVSIDPADDFYELLAENQDRFAGRKLRHVPENREEIEETSVRLAQKLMRLGVLPTFVPTLVAVEGLGFKYVEVSQILDMPVTTVASKLHRAKKLLVAAVTESDVARNDPGLPPLSAALRVLESTNV